MSNRAQWIMVAGVIVGLGALLAAGVAFTGDAAGARLGSAAPAFTATDLETGEPASLSRYEGQVILLNIWATWCLPCEQEMPSMQRLYDELGPRGLRIIAVSIDSGDPEAVRTWATERKLTFDIWHDPSARIERLYQTTGVPENFVIDRHGVIVKKAWATEWDHPTQKALFERLLNDTVDRGGDDR